MIASSTARRTGFLDHRGTEVRADASPRLASVALFAGLMAAAIVVQAAEGDPSRGSRHFGACLACHSIAPAEHLTGPSLHGVFGRKAGTAFGFRRYSPALKASDVVWDAKALDAWLADPVRFIPNNWMIFRGMDDAQARTDLIAFMKTLEGKQNAEEGAAEKPRVSARLANLKKAKPESLVKSIEYCGDAYRIRTVAGREVLMWEFNLRFKTDSSANGPFKGQPVLLPASMQGDRVFVIFNDPAEISAFIRRNC